MYWEVVPLEPGPDALYWEVVTRRQYKWLVPAARTGEAVELVVVPSGRSRTIPTPLIRYDPDSPYRTERDLGVLGDVVRSRIDSTGLLENPFGFRCCPTAPAAAAGAGPGAAAEPKHPPLRVGYEIRLSRGDSGDSLFGSPVVVVVRRSPAPRASSQLAAASGAAGAGCGIEQMSDPATPSFFPLDPYSTPSTPYPFSCCSSSSVPSTPALPLPGPDHDSDSEAKQKLNLKRLRLHRELTGSGAAPPPAASDAGATAKKYAEQQLQDDVNAIPDLFSMLSINVGTGSPAVIEKTSCSWVADFQAKFTRSNSLFWGLEAIWSLVARDGASNIVSMRTSLYAEACALFRQFSLACGFSQSQVLTILLRLPSLAASSNASIDPLASQPQSPAIPAQPGLPLPVQARASRVAFEAVLSASNPSELIRRIEEMFCGVQLHWPRIVLSGDAGMRAHTFANCEHQASVERHLDELSDALSGSEGASVAQRLAVVLVSEPVLDSRYNLTDRGHSELRAMFRGMRAATQSMALECSVIVTLFSTAGAGIALCRTQPIDVLRAACKRAWRLSLLVHGLAFGIVEELMQIPSLASAQLAYVVLEAVKARAAEDPWLYAEALRWAGMRAMQQRTESDDEALGHFYEAWSVLRKNGLSPSREEAWVIRGIFHGLARRHKLQEAKEVLAQMYWFNDEPEDSILEFWCRTSIYMYQLKTREDPADEQMSAMSALCDNFPPDMDTDAEQGRIGTNLMMYHMQRGSYLRALAAYRDFVSRLSRAPWSHYCDFVTSNILSYTDANPASMMRGIRAAVAFQRLIDFSGSTPILAHFLTLLGRLCLCARDFDGARSAFEDALARYKRYHPDIFTDDHPRIIFLRTSIEHIHMLPDHDLDPK
eukprot:tig00000492_g1572.t1